MVMSEGAMEGAWAMPLTRPLGGMSMSVSSSEVYYLGEGGWDETGDARVVNQDINLPECLGEVLHQRRHFLRDADIEFHGVNLYT